MEFGPDLRSFISHARRRAASYGKRKIHAALSAVGNTNYVPFIVLTRARSGSNLLLTYLNSHPDIYAEPEIFGRMRGRDPIAKLKVAFGKQPRRVKAKGVKIFYYHPLDHSPESLWKELEAMKALRVIHLRRENALRTMVSRKVAEGDKVWMLKAKAGKPAMPRPKVSFTVPELEAGFVQTKGWEDAGAERFREHPMLAVTYEGLVADPAGTFRRILAFLDLEYCEPRTNLEKQNPGRLPDLIENYQVLRNAFVNTPWSKYFED